MRQLKITKQVTNRETLYKRTHRTYLRHHRHRQGRLTLQPKSSYSASTAFCSVLRRTRHFTNVAIPSESSSIVCASSSVNVLLVSTISLSSSKYLTSSARSSSFSFFFAFCCTSD